MPAELSDALCPEQVAPGALELAFAQRPGVGSSSLSLRDAGRPVPGDCCRGVGRVEDKSEGQGDEGGEKHRPPRESKKTPEERRGGRAWNAG